MILSDLITNYGDLFLLLGVQKHTQKTSTYCCNLQLTHMINYLNELMCYTLKKKRVVSLVLHYLEPTNLGKTCS